MIKEGQVKGLEILTHHLLEGDQEAPNLALDIVANDEEPRQWTVVRVTRNYYVYNETGEVYLADRNGAIEDEPILRPD